MIPWGKLKTPTTKNNSSSKLSKNLEANLFKNLAILMDVKKTPNKKELVKMNR